MVEAPTRPSRWRFAAHRPGTSASRQGIRIDSGPRLEAGQRSPVFLIGGRFSRWSWYVRLPGPRVHPQSGVVRCELPGRGNVADSVARADAVTVALPRFASQPHKDTRAPQNLYPIAGLERDLRRRLGDAALLERTLRRVAAQVG